MIHVRILQTVMSFKSSITPPATVGSRQSLGWSLWVAVQGQPTISVTDLSYRATSLVIFIYLAKLMEREKCNEV